MSNFIPNSFQVPNAVIDELMAHISANALKCYLLIVRKTVGWQKELDYISTSQFYKFTGIKKDDTVFTALKELESLNLIERYPRHGKPTGFKLKTYPPQKVGYPKNQGTPKKEVGGTHPKNRGTQKTLLNTFTKNTLSKELLEQREGFKNLKRDNFNEFKSWLQENAEGWTFSISDNAKFDSSAVFEIRAGRIAKVDFGFLSKDIAWEIWAYLYSKQTKIREVLEKREVENAS